MKLNDKQKAMLETPCVVIDVLKAKQNIINEQAKVSASGCSLRPHVKTHKMPYFAGLQLEAGSAGITCCKVSEAEVMAEGGAEDIFIAYPLIGEFRLKRAMKLNARIKRLILAVDSLEGAELMNRFAEDNGVCFEVRLEVDTGAKRTGILRDKAVQLAEAISKMPGLKLTGIYTFKSLVFADGSPTLDNDAAAAEEAELMHEVAQAIRAKGIEINDISAGSTPTGIQAAASGLVTEVRQGTYIFKDFMLTKENCGRYEDIAARIFATVVSTPCEEYAVIDGGTKTFPMDITPGIEPTNYPGYAVVVGEDGQPDFNLQLRRMNEEHGMISAADGHTGLKVGQLIELVPIHVCTAINMQNEVYLVEGDSIRKEKVAARGMLV